MAMTNEQVSAALTATEQAAAHWENVALNSPEDVAFHCLDYAKHLRTIAECLRMDLLEREVQNPDSVDDK